MRGLQSTGEEAILPEMPGPVAQRIGVVGISAVSFTEGPGQRVRLAGNYDPVHVIRHEAVTQKARLELLRAVLDQVQVNATIRVGEEHSLAVDTALRDVVRLLRQHHTSYARHESEQWPDGTVRLGETRKHAGCPWVLFSGFFSLWVLSLGSLHRGCAPVRSGDRQRCPRALRRIAEICRLRLGTAKPVPLSGTPIGKSVGNRGQAIPGFSSYGAA